MSFRATTLRRHGAALFFLGILSVPAWSQTPPPARPVLFDNQDGITVSFVAAPSISSSVEAQPASSSQWLKVELHYSVTTKPTDPPFLSSVTFKVWIEGRDLFDPQGKPGEGIAVALTGSATYINIPSGKDNYAVFYVHPNTLSRYSTDTGSTDFDRKFNIHAEATVGGQLSDYYDRKKEDDLNWYKPMTVVDGLVYRSDQCCFIVDSPDHYPPLSLSQESSSSSASDSPPPPPPAPSPPSSPSPSPSPAPPQ
jgi:hypothetical protein